MPDSRAYPTRPFVGVGVVVLKGESVLLIRRGRPPRLGEWSLPGGAQQLGETVAEAAIREIREETGLEIAAPELLDVVCRQRSRFHLNGLWLLCEPLRDPLDGGGHGGAE